MLITAHQTFVKTSFKLKAYTIHDCAIKTGIIIIKI